MTLSHIFYAFFFAFCKLNVNLFECICLLFLLFLSLSLICSACVWLCKAMDVVEWNMNIFLLPNPQSEYEYFSGCLAYLRVTAAPCTVLFCLCILVLCCRSTVL